MSHDPLEIILTCLVKHYLLNMTKDVLLNIHFSGFLVEYTATFAQFKAHLLNTSIHFFLKLSSNIVHP